MWHESSYVNAVNVAKNLLHIQKYWLFPTGLLFWRARCTYKSKTVENKDPIRTVAASRDWSEMISISAESTWRDDDDDDDDDGLCVSNNNNITCNVPVHWVYYNNKQCFQSK